MPANNK